MFKRESKANIPLTLIFNADGVKLEADLTYDSMVLFFNHVAPYMTEDSKKCIADLEEKRLVEDEKRLDAVNKMYGEGEEYAYVYGNCRDNGMDHNQALKYVADKYDTTTPVIQVKMTFFRKRFKKERNSTIIAAYKRGVAVSLIAKSWGLQPQTVRLIIKKAGVYKPRVRRTEAPIGAKGTEGGGTPQNILPFSRPPFKRATDGVAGTGEDD